MERPLIFRPACSFPRTGGGDPANGGSHPCTDKVCVTLPPCLPPCAEITASEIQCPPVSGGACTLNLTVTNLTAVPVEFLNIGPYAAPYSFALTTLAPATGFTSGVVAPAPNPIAPGAYRIVKPVGNIVIGPPCVLNPDGGHHGTGRFFFGPAVASDAVAPPLEEALDSPQAVLIGGRPARRFGFHSHPDSATSSKAPPLCPLPTRPIPIASRPTARASSLSRMAAFCSPPA